MNPRHYIVSVLEMMQREFNLYFMVTPRDFDILYRWFEKRIPLTLIRDCVADVTERRQKQGRAIEGVGTLAHTVRTAFSHHQEKSVGAHSEKITAHEPGLKRAEFFSEPPSEIKEIVLLFQEGLQKSPPRREAVLAFHQAVLEKFAGDEELERRSTVFFNHLAPALRSDELLSRYRLNLLISRLGLPDFESELEEAS